MKICLYNNTVARHSSGHGHATTFKAVPWSTVHRAQRVAPGRGLQWKLSHQQRVLCHIYETELKNNISLTANNWCLGDLIYIYTKVVSISPDQLQEQSIINAVRFPQWLQATLLWPPLMSAASPHHISQSNWHDDSWHILNYIGAMA